MKISIKILAATILLGLLTMSARAFIVFQDDFNYPNGTLNNITWVPGSGNTLGNGVSINSDTVVIDEGVNSQPRAFFTNGVAGFDYSSGVSAGSQIVDNTTNIYYFGTNTGTAAIYFSYTLNVSSATNSYHAYFCDTNFTFVCRIFASTNTATPGDYRIGIGSSSTLTAAKNSGGTPTNIIQQDLNFGQNYTIVSRYLPASGLETVWVGPANETASGSANVANADFSAPFPNIAGFGLRSANGTSSQSGTMDINNLLIGTLFADVVPTSAGSNPPFFTQQPVGNSALFNGNNYTTTVIVGGDPATYQWYAVTNYGGLSFTNAIPGATTTTLTLNDVQTNQTGLYYAVAVNSAASVTSSVVNLTIYPAPIAPSVTSPAAAFSQTNTVGDIVTFPVTAVGVPPPAYKWFLITTNISNQPVTNAVAGSNNTGTNTATLTITGITNTEAGVYFVLVTNLVGTNTSPLITEVVNPVPTETIAALRSMVSATTFLPTNPVALFTVQGVVTTFTNMTTSTNSSEFYIQDTNPLDTPAAITVFWLSAAPNNLPPAGALVKVTGAMTNFDGLLEIQPVFTNSQNSVTILSTGNPLPAPQPVPFDPNILNNSAEMFAMGSMLMVASNVTLDASPTTFSSEATESITNNAREVVTNIFVQLGYTNPLDSTFVDFYTGDGNFLGATKPSGPVTVYGVMGYFLSGGANGASSSGWELTPRAASDFISYINVTNVLSHLTRKGDEVTNTFNQSFLEPGETLTTYVSIADPEGGSVTLTPSFTGLPADANWSNLTSGANGTGVFTFSPTTADESSNYVVNLAVTSTSGNNFNYSFTVYVPTPDEQQVYLSEVFANPTTTTTSPAYNPLKRSSESTEPNIPVNDQYVELVNLSSDTVSLQNWTLGNGSSTLHTFDQGNSLEAIAPSDAFVLYGGSSSANTGGDSTPTILGGYPGGYIEPENSGESLSLSTNGGVLALYDNSGYLVDRIVYPATPLNTSLSRFPTVNDVLVQQQYISTNYVTPGLQYDGGSWSSATKPITGVSNIVDSIQGRTNVILGFKVSSSQAYTIWNSSNLLAPFHVMYGQGLLTVGQTNYFTNAMSGPVQFYYMSTQ